MELTYAAVNGRIADLNDLASELRLERIRTGRRTDARGPRIFARSANALGRWLIVMGTALSGAPVDRVQHAGR